MALEASIGSVTTWCPLCRSLRRSCCVALASWVCSAADGARRSVRCRRRHAVLVPRWRAVLSAYVDSRKPDELTEHEQHREDQQKLHALPEVRTLFNGGGHGEISPVLWRSGHRSRAAPIVVQTRRELRDDACRISTLTRERT